MTETEIQQFLSLFPEDLMKLTPEAQKVSLVLYRLLIKGKSVSYADVASLSGLSVQEINRIIGQWGSEVLMDKDNNIIGFFGLSLNKTPHELQVDNVTLYTWCAWDTLFIPGLIDKAVTVRSACPVTRQEIKLKISPAGVLSVDPQATVVSLIIPDARGIAKNVIGTFCCYIHFFSSPKAGNSWVQQNPGTYIVSLNHAFHLGKRKNEARYPDVTEQPFPGQLR